MYPFHPNTVRLLRDADLIEASEARDHHRVPKETKRPLRTALLRRRHRAATHFDRTFEFCAGLNNHAMRRLEDHFKIVEIEVGSSLGVEGDAVDEFVFVLAGQVGVSIDGNVVAILGAGTHFGELPLLAGGDRPTRLASFVALSDTTVGTAPPDVFRHLLAEFPTVAEQVRATASIRGAYFAGREAAKAEAAYPVDHHQPPAPAEATLA